jgi:hypothetical protein
LMKWCRQTDMYRWRIYCWHSASHSIVWDVENVFGCESVQQVGADITVWPTLARQLYKAEGSDFCVAHCYWPLQSRDDGGIHGMEAFHVTWKAVQDNCELGKVVATSF